MKSRRPIRNIKYTSLIPLAFIIVGSLLLLIFEKELLWKAQELNLFLNTQQFFNEQTIVAGGFLTWMGTFFTQFFYHPWLGVSFLAVWWILLTWLIKKTFNTSSLLTIIPIAFILVTIVDLGYWVYILKLRGHFFVTTIGATAVTALLWAFRKVVEQTQNSNSRLLTSSLFPIITCAIAYPLLGIYGLAATLLMGIWIWRLEPRRFQALAVTIAALAAAVFIPIFCYHFVYNQTNLINIYFVELPLFYLWEEFHSYYIPYYLLLLYYVVMTLKPQTSNLKPQTSNLKTQLVPLLLLAASVVYVSYFWYRDDNFHRELAMQHAIDQLNWDKVVDIAAQQEDEPTRAIVVMRNIALARLNRQANEMYTFPNGSKAYNSPFEIPMMIVAGPIAYLHYGLTNSCYRLCTEMGVEYGWRAEHLKYLARCAMLNGETKLARKYVNILSKTTFHKDWASNLNLQNSELGFITHMMHYQDALKSDKGYVEDFIMNRLAESTDTSDTIFQEQALLASLYTKDINKFWYHLVNYARLHPGTQLPLHIQEAAMLFGSLQQRKNLDRWPFDDSVKESYRRFCEVTPQYDDMEVDVVREALYPLFGKTYYYDYYLMNYLPQY